MIPITILEEITRDQEEKFRQRDRGITRDIDFEKYLKTAQIVVISGTRRCGKSTLLRQFYDNFGSCHYLNFDDERLLDFEVGDFQNLMLAFGKINDSKTILLDEIQNIGSWERFARRIYDEGYKIFITGSNAKLLSSELATHLTGRYFGLELFPFSFNEFLNFKKIDWKILNSRKRIEILSAFDAYSQNGGFPEFLKSQDMEYLKKIYEDILYKDIIARFGIREVKSFRELANCVFSNFTQETSYNGLKNTLGFKSLVTVKNYVHYLQESYLAFEVFKYDFSLKKQYISNKKIFVIDNGLRNSVAFGFSEDRGRLLENLAFLELKRRGKEIYYFKDKKECDFLVKKKNKIIGAIQVAWRMDKNNQARELEGLWGAMEKFGLKEGIILTKDQEDENNERGKVKIIPVWKWLLAAEWKNF
ncbi:MAG: ATP-binding protein [Candidatus Nealsonbacteria bacterium DGGOD1a]|nr:MAG: ATP-binding protein [Candidatus Nealsonbacteria bacterium DGGOD1a]